MAFIAVRRGFMLSPDKPDGENAVPGVFDFFLSCLCNPIAAAFKAYD